MFKVGDRVEWCCDGRFDLYGHSDDPNVHDFGEVTSITDGVIWCKWESCEEELRVINENIRKLPTYTKTKTKIKAFLETLSENDDSWFSSERKIAEQVFDWFEAFVNNDRTH